MATKRLTLPSGDWIDLVTRLNHAQWRRIRQAYASPELDTVTEVVSAMAANWSVRDVDGADIPYPGGAPDGLPSEAIDRFPSDLVSLTFVEAAAIFKGGPDPNGIAATSNGSPPEPPSA